MIDDGGAIPVRVETLDDDPTADVEEVYDYGTSFATVWKRTLESHGACWRTDDFHGVPISVVGTEESEHDVDLEQLRAYLLEKEHELMQLPVRDWKDGLGPAYNTTTSRYDQYNILADAESVPAVGALKALIKQSMREFLACVARRESAYFDARHGGMAGEYFSPILQRLPPMPLYIMCWVNIYRESESLHWHVHNWPFQGYLSVASEGSATLFRSNVDPSRRWRFDHKKGLLFILPGGTLHSTTPWTNRDEPRITVAFNVAPAANARPDSPELWNRYSWVELFTAKEVRKLRQTAATKEEKWAMIVQRPPFKYAPCMMGKGIC